MEKETKETVVKTFYGTTLKNPIAFSWTFEKYSTPQEMRDAGDVLSLEEQMTVRNGQRDAKARAAAQTLAFDAAGLEKPNAANNEQVRLREAYKNLLTAKAPDGSPKYTDAEAKAVASTVTGVEWVTD